MKRYAVGYRDENDQVVEVEVDGVNFHEAKEQCPKKTKGGRPLAEYVREIPHDGVPLEAETAGDSGEAGDAEDAAAGGDEAADAEPAESEPAGDVGTDDPQGGGV